MPEVTLTTLHGLKAKGEKIAMLTCYDATFAKAACAAGVEILLVGDSWAWSCRAMTVPCRSRPPKWPTTLPASSVATRAP